MRTKPVSGFASKCLMSSCFAIAAIGLIAPKPAVAAALLIDDTLPNETINFSMSDFEGGFFLDGNLVQQGLGGPNTVNVPELGAGGGPLTHTFSADWITSGPVTETSRTIAFTEGTACCSDILTFAYSNTTVFGAPGGHLAGSFVSDAEGSLLPPPAGATLFAEGPPFVFNNTNITASAISDVSVVPAPPALLLFGPALLGLGFLWRRRDVVADSPRSPGAALAPA